MLTRKTSKIREVGQVHNMRSAWNELFSQQSGSRPSNSGWVCNSSPQYSKERALFSNGALWRNTDKMTGAETISKGPMSSRKSLSSFRCSPSDHRFLDLNMAGLGWLEGERPLLADRFVVMTSVVQELCPYPSWQHSR